MGEGVRRSMLLEEVKVAALPEPPWIRHDRSGVRLGAISVQAVAGPELCSGVGPGERLVGDGKPEAVA